MIKLNDTYIKEQYNKYVSNSYDYPETNRFTKGADEAFNSFEDLIDSLVSGFEENIEISNSAMNMATEYEESGFIAGYKVAYEKWANVLTPLIINGITNNSNEKAYIV